MKQIKDDMPPVSEFVRMNDGIKDGSPLNKYMDWLPNISSASRGLKRKRYTSTQADTFMDYSLYEDAIDIDNWREDASE